MSATPRSRAPDQLLAEAFGDFARRWSEERGAPVGVAAVAGKAARALSEATSAGHVCVDLQGLAGALESASDQPMRVDELRSALWQSGIVGSAGEAGAMPLVLDGADRLYLHRYFDYECRLAQRLALQATRAGRAPADSAVPPNVLRLLDLLFADAVAAGTADWQKIAVLTALLGHLTLISGGPGTGKTTTIVNLLACLIENEPSCRIALAAPTGKAAARVIETVRQRANQLPPAIAARLPDDSFTIHRLLGVTGEGGFRHGLNNPLPYDVIVVDEASMLDLALATQLFEAVRADAKIILVGDKNQLAAVESGAVFGELSAQPIVSAARVERLAGLCAIDAGEIQAPRPMQKDGLVDCVVWLRRNYRFAGSSSIGQLAADITAGRAEEVVSRLQCPPDGSLQWLDESGATLPNAAIRTLLARYAPYIDACRTRTLEPQDISGAFARCRILCAVRDGYRGTDAINDRLSAHFRRELRHPLDPGARFDWYPGRPVIVLRNDYVLQLFNGDIGIALPDAAGDLVVYFPDGMSGYRAVPPGRLPEHETAFAMTVHKAQGSEFDEVVVLLPADMNRIITQELLYTAITRARNRVTVVGAAAVIRAAVMTKTERLSGLLARMAEARTANESRSR
ncbi:MAG: exodeoxyribonuclease V subunit alpha [Pseudomonadota bacterium]|nr:exodeoxyribonuclease V subunit alpha [Pseudomonadota bacterium]